MPVIGTAGHVDHGKSTLVRALTGLDPDRWEEEKARGLTIDLGFAWTQIGDHEVSFVDVPGHEQFIKNMLAGIESIDVALLVVAADEGWMPQSEEHLAVLDLLEVGRGVVALTKVDRVDEDLAELAQLEISEHIEGTSMESAKIIATSALEEGGVADLLPELERLVGEVETRSIGRPRLWIDRSFTIAGAGTVVTGTLLDGDVTVGDRLQLWPADRAVRVRSVQTHERDVQTTGPQRRVALNLSGIDRDDATRGSMVGIESQWESSNRFHVSIKPARYVDEIADRGAYHIHFGSGSWPGKIRMVDDLHAVITIDTPLPVKLGDRFIVRDTGRRLVVGGGRILDPAPPQKAREILPNGRRLTPVVDAPPDDQADVLLSIRESAATSTLAAHTGGGTARSGVLAGSMAISMAALDRTRIEVRQLLVDFHRSNPLRPGMPIASLPNAVDLPIDAVEVAIETDPDLVREGALVRLSQFEVDRTDREHEWAAARTALREAGLAVPRTSELDIDRELLHALVRDGELVRISEAFVFLPTQIDEIVAQLRHLPDGFTVSEFKDCTGLSRKYAVPFLEWTDRSGMTIRTGDTRRLRTQGT